MCGRVMTACPAATLCYIAAIISGAVQLLYSLNYGLAVADIEHFVQVSSSPCSCWSCRRLQASPCTPLAGGLHTSVVHNCRDDLYRAFVPSGLSWERAWFSLKRGRNIGPTPIVILRRTCARRKSSSAIACSMCWHSQTFLDLGCRSWWTASCLALSPHALQPKLQGTHSCKTSATAGWTPPPPPRQW